MASPAEPSPAEAYARFRADQTSPLLSEFAAGYGASLADDPEFLAVTGQAEPNGGGT